MICMLKTKYLRLVQLFIATFEAMSPAVKIDEVKMN